MIRKVGIEGIPAVLEYIGYDYIQCFYMYMDILECGIDLLGFTAPEKM